MKITLKNSCVSGKNLSNKGFTLIEIMIAIGIVAVISVGIYGFFVKLSEGSTRDQIVADVQQKIRLSVELMAQDIRMAGLDPTGEADAGITRAEPNSITFTSDIDNDGELTSPFERITYALNGNLLEQTAVLAVGGTEVTDTLMNNVSRLEFFYYNSNGTWLNPPTNLSRIAFVEIVMEVTWPYRKDDIQRTYATTIKLRN